MTMIKQVPTTFDQDFAHGNVKHAMVEQQRSDLWKVNIDDLHVLDGLNVRTKNEAYDGHIERLAQSMLSEGYYPDKALAVFIDAQDRVIVRDGHSRLEAARRANELGAQITQIPCVTAPRGTSMTDITVALVKSNTGKPLLPIEVAVVCKRLSGWGWDAKKIGERLDYTQTYVLDLLGLLEAPAAVQDLVSAGKVAAATVIRQTKKEGSAAAAKTIVEASAAAPDGKVTAKTLRPAATISAAGAAVGIETGPTSKDLLKALRLVFNDKNFAKLSDKAQSAVLEFVS